MLRDRGERVPQRPTVNENIPKPADSASDIHPSEPVSQNRVETENEDSVSSALDVPVPSPPVPESGNLPPVDVLKDQILGALRKVRHSLAAAMEKAELWEVNESTLVLTFRSTFEKSFLEKERHEIEKTVLESLNYKLHLKTQLRKQEEQSGEKKWRNRWNWFARFSAGP